MSVAGIPQDHPDRNILKKSFHRRNDSGELDVFEAARYFSGYNEGISYNGSSFTQKAMKEENRSWRGGRISLDMPIRHVLNPQKPHHHHQVVSMDDHKQMNIKDKKYKQPSSPGGRLASFLNSLFNQSSSKKKSKSSSSQSMKDEQDESPGGRRKRRSSISHFRSSSTTVTDSKSLYSSSSSGFRTPPAYAQTPTKSYKDFNSFAKQNSNTSTTTTNSGTSTSTTTTTTSNNTTSSANHVVKPSNTTATIVPTSEDLAVQKENKNMANIDALPDKDKVWIAVEKYPSSDQKKLGLFTRFDEEYDDGADSDSSSDLFELQNYDLGGCYSSGLPVYETTNMDNIKRGAPISSA